MIVSETRIVHPQNAQITGPAMTLSPGVVWLVNQWDDIVEEDVDPVCNALVKHAGFFFALRQSFWRDLSSTRWCRDPRGPGAKAQRTRLPSLL